MALNNYYGFEPYNIIVIIILSLERWFTIHNL